jgi:predicted ArsR family transcriptional regulator
VSGRANVHPTWVTVFSDSVRLRIVSALSETALLTIAELSRDTHTSDRAIRRHLEVLVANGLVYEHRGERDGLTPGRPASRFALDSGARGQIRDLVELLRQPLPTAPR